MQFRCRLLLISRCRLLVPMSVASDNFISTLLDVNSPFQSLQTSLDLVSVLADLAQVPRKLYQVTIDCVSGLSATRQRALALWSKCISLQPIPRRYLISEYPLESARWRGRYGHACTGTLSLVDFGLKKTVSWGSRLRLSDENCLQDVRVMGNHSVLLTDMRRWWHHCYVMQTLFAQKRPPFTCQLLTRHAPSCSEVCKRYGLLHLLRQ